MQTIDQFRRQNTTTYFKQYHNNCQECQRAKFSNILASKACNFTKINTLPGMCFTFFKLYRWYQTAQCTTYQISREYAQNIRSKMKKFKTYEVGG